MSKQRLVGIRHRVKRTVDGEAHPTQLFIDGQKSQSFELEFQQHELDFIHGLHAIHWRDAVASDDVSIFQPHQLKVRKPSEEENVNALPKNLVVGDEKSFVVVTKVPDRFIGLEEGDIVLMPLGGSGDYLAFAMSVQAEKIGATVLRVPPKVLKEYRESQGLTIDDDAETIIGLYRQKPELFYPVAVKERDMIKVREIFRARKNAQLDRMACQQRIYQSVIGDVFVSPEGLYPQGGIEKRHRELEANDETFQNLLKVEKDLEKRLAKALMNIPAYVKIFQPIKGVGPVIAAGILTAVGDIRLFRRKGPNLQIRAGGLKKFCGVAVNPDGSFQRKRVGQDLGFNPGVRQSLYLLGDQFNRRPDSDWGRALKKNKELMRQRTPYPVLRITQIDGVEVVERRFSLEPGKFKHNKAKGTYELEIDGETKTVKGKLQHTDAHIHRQATWRTLTHFVEFLYSEWNKLERGPAKDDATEDQSDGEDQALAA